MDFCLPAYNQVTPAMSQLYQLPGLNTPESSNMNESSSSIKGKRKRSRGCFKSSEEMEIQRTIHIAVERNRRKQMNKHLQVLHRLMPPSYVQRAQGCWNGDQASIIGGAIEFVKHLEQLLKCLESQKRPKMSCIYHQSPSTLEVVHKNKTNTILNADVRNDNNIVAMHQQNFLGLEKEMREKTILMENRISSLIDMEVKLIGSDEAVINIFSQKSPRQLLNIIVALQEDLHLTILRTSITTIDRVVFYSFKVKISTI